MPGIIRGEWKGKHPLGSLENGATLETEWNLDKIPTAPVVSAPQNFRWLLINSANSELWRIKAKTKQKQRKSSKGAEYKHSFLAFLTEASTFTCTFSSGQPTEKNLAAQCPGEHRSSLDGFLHKPSTAHWSPRGCAGQGFISITMSWPSIQTVEGGGLLRMLTNCCAFSFCCPGVLWVWAREGVWKRHFLAHKASLCNFWWAIYFKAGRMIEGRKGDFAEEHLCVVWFRVLVSRLL